MMRNWSVAVWALLLASGSASAAQNPAEFYRDRTVTIVVAGGLGSTLGLYCRLVATHWARHIPGHPNVICQPRPGAGGATATAYMYNAAPKDGTVVGEIQAAVILLPALRDVKFDVTKFTWLGSVTPKPAVISVWHTAPAKTLEEARHTQLILGSTGKGSETYIVPALMNGLLGTKFRIVEGYRAEDINLAMERGEVNGRRAAWSAWVSVKPDWIRDGKLIHLVHFGPRIPELPTVPSLRDVVKTADERKMVDFIDASPNVGMGFYLPPGVPADRVRALRRTFMEVLKDTRFLADAKKSNAEVNPISGEDLQRTVAGALATPKPILRRMRSILGFKGK